MPQVTSTKNSSNSFVVRVTQSAFVPVAPNNVMNVTTTAGAGSITVNWERPDKANYAKVVVTCYNAQLNTTVTKEITDKTVLTTTFSPTFAFAGDYEFTVKTYGLTGMETDNPVTVTGTSNAWSEKVQVALTASMITANATQTNDGGGIPALVDGKTSTYYHSYWNSASDDGKPHRLQFALPAAITGEFYFEYAGRATGNGDGDIKSAIVYGSESGVDNDGAWTEIGTINYTMPSTRGAVGTANNHLTISAKYSYLRFVPTARRNKDNLLALNGSKEAWFNLSEIYLYEVHDEAWYQANH